MAGATGSPAGWRTDPYRRHELRYWDGLAWTPHVSDVGVLGHDPVFPIADAAAQDFLAPAGRRRPPRSRRDLAAAWAVGGFFAVVSLAVVTAARTPAAAPERATAQAAAAATSSTSAAGTPATTTRTRTATTTRTRTVTATASSPSRTRPTHPHRQPPSAQVTHGPDARTGPGTGSGTDSGTGSPPGDRRAPGDGQSDRPASPAPRAYPNCTQLNAVYPHGVAMPGAVDRTSSGNPVTDFTVDATTYWWNVWRDGDHDGVACEKH